MIFYLCLRDALGSIGLRGLAWEVNVWHADVAVVVSNLTRYRAG